MMTAIGRSARARRTSFVKVFMSTMLMLGVTHSSIAGPRIVEEQAKIEIPGPTDQIVSGIGMDGSSMLVATRRNFSDPVEGLLAETFVYLYELTAGNQWRHVSALAQERTAWEQAATFYVALRGGIAAVKGRALRIFEHSPSGGWSQTAQLESSADHYIYGARVRIDAGTVVVGGRSCAWEAFGKDASGAWARIGGATPSETAECFADIDISGGIVAAGHGYGSANGTGVINIYSVSSSVPSATIASPFGDDFYFGALIALNGRSLIAAAHASPGLHVFRQGSNGVWEFSSSAAAADAWQHEKVLNLPYLKLNEQFAVGAYPMDDHRAPASGSIAVFRRNSNDTLTEIARLLASDARENLVLGARLDMSGRRIAASSGYLGEAGVYVFELPTDLAQPADVQDDFEGDNGARWTAVAGSAFSVVSTARSRTYRQSSLAGGAGSYLTNMDWTDQSIQADVRPLAFNGANRWFGLVVRRTGSNDYYYLTARSSNVIELRRMANGAYQTLASAPLEVVPNRNYRLRLEAIGTRIRGLVDGQLAVEARDTTHRRGQAGVQMYKTSADYDNMVVTPNPQLVAFADSFSATSGWFPVSGDWGEWTLGGNKGSIYRQSSTERDARVVTGVNTTGDQIVQVRARARSFSGPNRWFGVLGRYIDDRNHYYVTVRSNGTVSLRKLVNGTVTVLGTASLTVTTNRWYDLRLEIVGDTLRVYVDGELHVQARDTDIPAGRYGLATYKASADFDDLLVTQP